MRKQDLVKEVANGANLSEAQAGNTMEDQPFILIVPGLFLFMTVFSFNLLGEQAVFLLRR